MDCTVELAIVALATVAITVFLVFIVFIRWHVERDELIGTIDRLRIEGKAKTRDP